MEAVLEFGAFHPTAKRFASCLSAKSPMQTHLLLREYPRALALRPTLLEEVPRGVLMFEQYSAPSISNNRAIAKLVRMSEFEDSNWRILNSKPVFGCLGIINVQEECFLAVVTDCNLVGRIRAGEEVYKINSVAFYSLSSSRYGDLDASTRDVYGAVGDDDLDASTTVQHPCAQLQKLLSVGNFYFSPGFDLTKTIQARTSDASLGVYAFDERFLWNKFLISGLLDFRAKLGKENQEILDKGGFLVLAIRGYVGVESVWLDNERMDLSIISKLSCKRAGTRFNSRGIDDDGHVANFVETETVLYSDRKCYAFTQVRGSVPVFWEHQGIVNQKVQFARGPQAAKPAVKRHFTDLVQRYESVCNVNLLSARDNSTEAMLSNTYKEAVKLLGLPKDQLFMIDFDLHSECRGGNYDNLVSLHRRVENFLVQYGYFAMECTDGRNFRTTHKQSGVFRTNCMDCLDRTNLVQNEISRMALLRYLEREYAGQSGRILYYDDLISRHAHLWAENGDGLSRIYAGTGALKSAFTRTGKVTFMNVLSDAKRSANRFFINTFQDKAKQEVIDQLLGKLAGQQETVIHDPISDSVTQLLKNRIKEYSTSRKITIFCGTYNVNGKSFKNEKLDPWLLPYQKNEFTKGHFEKPDIYAVGFQEIVELSPQQVMATDADTRKEWEEQVGKTLNEHASGAPEYVLLRSNQLVGAALMIFVKTSIVDEIRNVETAIKKTGIMGIAGNKGAVAIRMDYHETSFCFVAAHFASGQNQIEDRHADFYTINNNLRFPRGRSIDSHDNIVWVSDLNYRVSLTNEEARECIRQDNISELLDRDQLRNAMRKGHVFQGYSEGDITFKPTYKYDIGTNIYDTSEKQRVPGWTDRIIYKGSSLDLLWYYRAELFTSDHRPVFAIFNADILILDQEAKSRLQKSLYQQSLDKIDITPPELPKRKVSQAPLPASRPSPAPVEKLIDLSMDDDEDQNQSLPLPSTMGPNWWENGLALPKADKRKITPSNPFKRPQGQDVTSLATWKPINPTPIVASSGKYKQTLKDSNFDSEAAVITPVMTQSQTNGGSMSLNDTANYKPVYF